MEMVTYNGYFGEDGISTADQPKENTAENGRRIIYAYDSSKQNYLFLNGEETAAESFVFRAESMSMPAPQTYAAYEPREDQSGMPGSGTIDIAQMQVRVFGGNIQVFDGSNWIDMGSVDAYIAADPVTAGNQVAEGGNIGGTETTGQGITAIYTRRGGGQVTPVATPKPTSRPTAPVTPTTPVVPVTPTVPVPAPLPAATPIPDPVQPSNPEPAPQPSNPEPAPQPSNPEPVPQPTPEPAPEPPTPTDPPITGGDSDVEWSPDLM